MTSSKMPVKAEPFKHQKEAFNFAKELYDDAKNGRGVAMLVEMGCGKTQTAISVAGELFHSGKIKNCLWCLPYRLLGYGAMNSRSLRALIMNFPFYKAAQIKK